MYFSPVSVLPEKLVKGPPVIYMALFLATFSVRVLVKFAKSADMFVEPNDRHSFAQRLSAQYRINVDLNRCLVA